MNIRLAVVCVCAFSWPLLGQGGFDGPGRYEIMNLKSGKVLDLDRNDQTTVMQFSARGTDNQVWYIRPAGGGFHFLRNAMNGYALDAGGGGESEPVRGMPFNGGDSQKWRLEPGKDGNALIMSRLGRTLDIPGGTSRDGAHVQVHDVNGDSNQRFTLRRVSGGRDLEDRDWDRPGDRDRDRGGVARGPVLTCSSNNGERVFCGADTRSGVQLLRQISESPCRQGETWGWDERGVWVDRGCRAEFTVNRPREESRRKTITCSSDNGGRVFCEIPTRGMRVELTRQISESPCRQGETWNWDERGIWVDRGCRAEFSLSDR
jgi:hypothetical protein